MEKLGDIVIDNSLTLTVSYQVDQHLLAKNFTTIINALKELQASQQRTDSQLKDLSSLKDRFDQLGLKVDKIEKNGLNNNKQSNSTGNQNIGQGDPSSNNYDNLAKRVEKSENNILDNIKDINLINKDLTDVKKLIEDLKNQLAHLNPNEASKNDKIGYGVEDVASNVSKELHLSAEKMKELEVKLLKAEEQISKHDKDIKDLLDGKDKNKSGQSQAPSSGRGDKDLQELKRDLREKLQIINKKISNLQSDTDNHEQQIAYIKDIIAQQETDKPQQEGQTPVQNKEETTNISKQDLNELRRKIEEVDKRQIKDVKNLLEEINNLKKQLQAQAQRIDSKTNIEDENMKLNQKKSTIQKDDLNDKLNDLIMKVNYLEKLISGSKSVLTEEKNPEKLPALNRPRKRQGNMTVYQEKDKSGISRKDISELKAELEAWIKSLFEENKDRENIEDIELKIQQIKKSLERKADAEGTKKGFSFLENKITQLYLFLTEPETEDAMIVRKGFNCLSCSKRVEKLRGRIGPKLNWNNMTSTNYSPPRVGYSKPMGEHSVEKEDDL